MRNLVFETAAIKASNFLKKKLGINNFIKIGIILGTGWGDKLKIEDPVSIPFDEVPGFSELDKLEGHERKFVYGTVADREVIVLQGRIHLNEHPDYELMVRLQVEVLMQLGVETLIITCAAGALPESELNPGDLVVIDGFITLFAPRMPLRTGEFISPEDALSGDLRTLALSKKESYSGEIKMGGYAMVLGPYFEGRKYDKLALAQTGAKIVGMSTLPETCIAALYESDVLALAFITNDAVGVHSHKENMEKAKEFSSSLGRYLSEVINAL